MDKPVISENFTVSDIHKIREYNYETTKDMTFEERQKYRGEKFNIAMAHMEELRNKQDVLSANAN